MLTQELLINPEEVDAAFRDCLFKNEELNVPEEEKGPEGAPKDAVLVRGITSNYGFHSERLESKREQIKEWLSALPDAFKKSGGGGMSFLNACDQANGVQWTGLHQRMEQLFCLGEALGLAEPCTSRETWKALPGSMPYYVINIE